jgi:hypothetical protein
MWNTWRAGLGRCRPGGIDLGIIAFNRRRSVKNVLIVVIACVSSNGLYGCSATPKPKTTNIDSPAEAKANTTDILSVDQKAGTFVALARRDHTTERIVARCGTVCPSPGKNFAGFWSLPASQVPFEVIEKTEIEGLQAQ